jgi:hypothetical protein
MVDESMPGDDAPCRQGRVVGFSRTGKLVFITVYRLRE